MKGRVLVSISEIACLVLCVYSIRVELDGRSTNLVLNDHLIPSTLAVSVFPIKKKHTNSLEFPPEPIFCHGTVPEPRAGVLQWSRLLWRVQTESRKPLVGRLPETAG